MTNINDECQCLHALMSTRHIVNYYNNSIKESGLEIQQFHLLVEIINNPQYTQQRFADVLGVERTTLCRRANLLIKSGFLSPTNSTSKRKRCYRVTDKGLKVVDCANTLRKKADALYSCEFDKID